jgi:hypothetical protein
MTTQAEFFQAHAVDGVLDDKLMAQMLNLPQGDSGEPAPQSGTPEPTPAPTPAPVEPTPEPTPAPTPTPVILAADGVHTIEYAKLVEARDEAKTNKARADAAEAELAALKGAAPAPTPGPTPAPTTAPVAGADKPDFGDYSDEALAAGLEKWVEKRVAARVDEVVALKLAPIEEQKQRDAATAHFKPIYDKHPNLDAMLESAELEGWIKAQPSYAQAGIRDVLAKGTSDQVIELFDSFVKATGKAAAPPPPQATAAPSADPKAAAKAVIDAAAAKPPNSLSEIPGTAAVHDEAAAMLEASPTALLNKFAGKSPEQIEALMNKAL